jgi:protease secretion system outer membrane protein
MRIIRPLLLLSTLAPAALHAQTADEAVIVQGPVSEEGGDVSRTSSGALVGSLGLAQAFDFALDNDAEYRSAEAEFDVNRAAARQSLTSYLPSANYSMTNIPTDGLTRQVFSVSQPLLSLERLATFKQRGPRNRYADVLLLTRQNDLAQRLMKAVSDYVRANESAKLNAAKVDALEEQSSRATKLYRGGLGTITDAREVEVRFLQARANQSLLIAERDAAARRIGSMTGVDLTARDFVLPERLKHIVLQPKEALSAGVAQSPQVLSAQLTERIASLESQRVRGSLLPTVQGSASYTTTQGRHISYVGLSVTAPVNAGGFFHLASASASARRSSEDRRRVQEQTEVNFERYYGLVKGGQDALQGHALAIEAAELSVTANRKSYDGGVRSNLDVINAIQTAFEVKNQYINSALSLADNYLNLQLTAGVPASEAIENVEHFLFGGQG